MLYRGRRGIFIISVFLLALCLSLCNSRSLPLSLSLFSYLIEGCRILQSGWWSSNSIYSTAQRQTESRREKEIERREREREREGWRPQM